MSSSGISEPLHPLSVEQATQARTAVHRHRWQEPGV